MSALGAKASEEAEPETSGFSRPEIWFKSPAERTRALGAWAANLEISDGRAADLLAGPPVAGKVCSSYTAHRFRSLITHKVFSHAMQRLFRISPLSRPDCTEGSSQNCFLSAVGCKTEGCCPEILDQAWI